MNATLSRNEAGRPEASPLLLPIGTLGMCSWKIREQTVANLTSDILSRTVSRTASLILRRVVLETIQGQ